VTHILTVKRLDSIKSGSVPGPFLSLQIDGGPAWVATKEHLVDLFDHVLGLGSRGFVEETVEVSTLSEKDSIPK
jgi:hypothetical protein